MSIRVKTNRIGVSFILSIIIHLLLIIFLFLHFLFNQKKEEPKQPHLFSPAYLYHYQQPVIHAAASNSDSNNKKIENKIENKIQKKELINNSIENTQEQPPTRKYKKSLLTATQDYLEENRRQLLTKSAKYDNPVYMIGDQNTSPDPLIRLLAYVLSAHFQYPDIARKFGITGKTIIGMTLYPNGRLHNIQIIESSGNIDLDHAALYAVNTAEVIKQANRYISQPKNFIIGFVFRTYYQN